MAKRRSLNRRWSRRSVNATELDQDSELFDEDNPVWWKNLPDASTIRPSTQTFFAETTAANLTLNSLVSDSKLQDKWWDNLDRTSLQSSRRFSTRKSVNPEEDPPESFVSEGDDDVSIKKRKVLLRARAKRSIGTENFLKAFDDSDVAHSEPVPNKKRKTQSPARSEVDLIHRKIQTRQSRSLAKSKDSNTSNDTDIVIKTRPKLLKKGGTNISSDVYDEILSKAGTSKINTSKNASIINTPEKIIDSNESGFMGPPITGSHRKRLSTISKKLDLTSDESEDNGGSIKPRTDFRPKSKENASFNPFDEILSGQLNKSTASTEAQNKSGSSSNATKRRTKSLKLNQSRDKVSLIRDDEEEPKEAFASKSQLRETERSINRQTLSGQEKDLQKNDRRSVSVLKEDSRVSKRRGKNEEDENETAMIESNVQEKQNISDELEMIEKSVIDGNSPKSQNIDRRSASVMIKNARLSKRRTRDASDEFNIPETQEDDGSSIRRSKHSTMIEESMEIDNESQDKNRRSSVLKKHSRESRKHTKDATDEWNVPETQENADLSIRRIKNSTMIEESVDIDELPESQDKNRRSSSVLKGNSRFSKRNTINEAIEEVSETKEDSRILIIPGKNSTVIGESMDIDKLPESQEIDRRSSSVLKGNSRVSKIHTKNVTMEEAATDEWEIPEIHENSRISIRPIKNSTMIEESIDVDKLTENRDRDRKSSLVSKKRLRDSKSTKKTTTEDDELPTFDEKSAKFTSTLKENVKDLKLRIDSMQHEKLSEKTGIQFFEDWESSGSKGEDEAIKSHERSHNNSHNSSLITKNLAVSITRLPPTKNSHNQHTKEFEKTIEKNTEKKKSHVKLRSVGSRSRNLTNSAYELPDKERSASPIISTSENESINKNLLPNRSMRKFAKNQQKDNRKSVDRSFSDTSKKNLVNSNVSRSRIDLAANLGERDTKLGSENSTKSKNDLFAEHEDSDQSINEELVIGSQKSNLNLSRKSSRAESKINDSKRAESRQDKKIDSNEEEHHLSHKSKLNSRRNSSKLEKQIESKKSAMSTNSSQENPSFDENISEAETIIANDEISETYRNRSRQAEQRLNKSRKSSTQPNVSGKREESGESITEEEFSSKLLEQPSKDKSYASQKKSGRINVSQQRIESDESINEEELNLKSLNQSKDKNRENRKNSGRVNVSKQRIESDESISEEETNLKTFNEQKDKSRVSQKNSKRLNVSKQRIESDESISEEELNLKSLNQSKDKNRENRKNSRRVNVSKQRIESDEIDTEEELNLKSLNQSKDKNRENRKNSGRVNVSKQHKETDESISEEEANLKSMNQPEHKNRKNSGRVNVSKQHKESDESITEEEANLKSLNQTTKEKNVAGKKSVSRQNISKQHLKFNESGTKSGRVNVSKQHKQSDESISEEETNLKSLNQPTKEKHVAGKKSISHQNISKQHLKFNESGTKSGRVNVSKQHKQSDESISEEETNLKSLNQPTKEKNVAGKKSISHQNISKQHLKFNESGTKSGRVNVSKQHKQSDESISEEEANLKSLNQPTKDKNVAGKKSISHQNISKQHLKFNESGTKSGRVNVSKQHKQSDESISEEEANLKSLNQPTKDKNVTGKKSVSHQNISKQHLKFNESGTKDKVDLENVNPILDNESNGDNPVDKLIPQDVTNRDKSSFSNVENIEEDASTSIPSVAIPLAPILTKPPENKSSILSKSNKNRSQKNITDFFASKFLQRNDNSKIFNSQASFDKEKFDLVRKEIETKRRQMAILRNDESSKKKEITKLRSENATKMIKLRAKENTTKVQIKPPKVVDKAYIVNGRVYKRPKLPRPKPWVTDRLYRHLWKRLEPKYNLRTRIKSEHFVEQLSEVVALTIRRKKYDSYKAEVDALMKEMARLNIIKTRNDFYDFCYDFLPYDFRVKATPMILPGNIRNIPYDPATLRTPILPES